MYQEYFYPLYVGKILRNMLYSIALLGFFVISCSLQKKNQGMLSITICNCKCQRWSKSSKIRRFGFFDFFFYYFFYFISLVHTSLARSSPTVIQLQHHRSSCAQGLMTAVVPPSRTSLSFAACTDYSNNYSVSRNNHISAAFCSSSWLVIKLHIDVKLVLIMFLVGSIHPLWCLLWPCPSVVHL